jgi:hypothetical protein
MEIKRLLGWVVQSSDGGYEEAGLIWNADIQRRPAIIAHCTRDRRYGGGSVLRPRASAASGGTSTTRRRRSAGRDRQHRQPHRPRGADPLAAK